MTFPQKILLKDITRQIDDLFADEVGPVAVILCAEALAYWLAKLKLLNANPGLRNLHIYVNKLAQAIDEPSAKQAFLDSVLKIDALRVSLKSAAKPLS